MTLLLFLLLLGLGAWCVALQLRLGGLGRDLAALRRSLRDSSSPAGTPAPAESPTEFPITAFVETVAAKRPTPEVASAPLKQLAAEARTSEPPPELSPHTEPASPAPPRRSVGEWLSENGLAWIGGGALALGGMLLVAYAAERGFFTPMARVTTATLIGLAAVAAGEVLRRGLRGVLPNPLVAALTTAAGASILYGAAWAAGGLYGFIPPWAAAALLTLVSASLLALAFWHGEPLGVLALAGAFSCPLVSGVGAWSGMALDAYGVLVVMTGLGATISQSWFRVGIVTLAGAFLWAISRDISSDPAGLAALAIAAIAGALAQSLIGLGAGDQPRGRATLLLQAGIGGGGFLAFFASDTAGLGPVMGALTVTAVAAAIALGSRAKAVSDRWLLVPAAWAGLLALMSLVGLGSAGLVLWLVAGTAAFAVAGFACTLGSEQPGQPAVIAAAGTAFSMTLASRNLPSAAPGWDFLVFLALGALLALGTAWLGRRRKGEKWVLAVAAWIAVSAEIIGLALHAGLNARAGPAAYAVLGLVVALLSVRLRWRGFAESAAVACLASFGALLLLYDPAAPVTLLAVLMIAGGAAVIQFVVWWAARRNPDAATSVEAISTLAIMTTLLAAFQAIQAIFDPGHNATPLLGSLAVASGRTVLLTTAGLMLSIRGAATPIGRFRAPVFLALGVVHGLLMEGLLLNPWWGAFAKPVFGPPIIDVIAIGLLAPGFILAEAARRASRSDRRFAGVAFGAALLFIVLWLATEIRRLFHSPDLTVGSTGFEEIAAYASGAMALAFGLELARDRFHRVFGQKPWVSWALAVVSWTGLALALFLLAYMASPWWGPLPGKVSSPWLLATLYIAAIAFGAGLARLARGTDRLALARAATIAAGVEGWVLITLVIRYLFRGDDMRAVLTEASVETWTFSAVWALYGFAALALGASRRDAWVRGFGLTVLLITTAKVFLFDLARLEGVIRAASFLALGVILLVSALAARRLRGGHGAAT
jgi:uncharacterized membrane protein